MKNKIIYTGFAGVHKLGSGSLAEVAEKIKYHFDKKRDDTYLIFEDQTGRQVYLDLSGSWEQVRERLVKPSAGKEKHGTEHSKLQATAREITLLPRHWDWLAEQPGGASVTLRKLIEEAKKKNQGADQIRKAQSAVYEFMLAMAGDQPGFEEALRALFANDAQAFQKQIAAWPQDVSAHTWQLGCEVFKNVNSKT